MLRRRRPRSSLMPQDVTPVVRLWLLRLLVPLGAYGEFIQRAGFANDVLAHVLSLGEYVDPEDLDFEPHLVRSQLRKLHKEIEDTYRDVDSKMPILLGSIIARLASLIGLSELDCSILAFVVMLSRIKNGR